MKKNLFITHIRGLIARGVVIDSLGEKVKTLSAEVNIPLSKGEVKYIIKEIEKQAK